MRYFFTLGTHPKLSISEVEAVLKRLGFEFTVERRINDFLIVEVPKELPNNLIEQLGGVIKFGKVLKHKSQRLKHKINSKFKIQNPKDAITAEKLKGLVDYKGADKFYFGISVYGDKNVKINKLGLGLKKILKEQGLKVRFVTGKENPLSSVIVQKNKLTQENGIEIVIMKDNEQVYVGQTIAVQDFEQYSKIDYGRPARDQYSGMLPPKIAQIMVNLSEVKAEARLLDPFCGSGTILQMAGMLGYKNLIGFDISSKAIKDTTENLEWIKDALDINFNEQLKQIEVKNLEKELKHDSIDAIVTEPFMGPPLKGSESKMQIQTNLNELTSLYKNALAQFEKVLKPDGKIVMIIPEFLIKGKRHTIVLEKILPDKLKQDRNWQYSRPDQKIIRNIYKLKKA